MTVDNPKAIAKRSIMRSGTLFRRFGLHIAALNMLVGFTANSVGQADTSSLFFQAKMQEMDLKGLRVRIGRPVEVTSQLGWQQSGPPYDKYDWNGEPAKARGGAAWPSV